MKIQQLLIPFLIYQARLPSEGYHPRGIKGSGKPLVPSAALLKAILINSAEPLTGLFDRNCSVCLPGAGFFLPFF